METIELPQPTETFERELVTLECVTAVTPIDNADAIEVAKVRGWNLVIKKGEVAVGDEVLYFEIDSFLPLEDERFAFLAPRGEKLVDGVRGHVLKTARMRGVYSQGLAMPLHLFPELGRSCAGADVAALLGVTKYEPPVPAELEGQIAGGFPTAVVPKTSADRIQNLIADFPALRAEHDWIATEKIDGTSTTFINDGGTLRVAGRNWEYSAPASASDATLPWLVAADLDILSILPEGWSAQGELYGTVGLARNRLKVEGRRFSVFSVFAAGAYVPRSQWPAELLSLSVPVHEGLELPETLEDAIEQANGIKSLINPAALAEGIVWHTADGSRPSALGGRSGFKVISNKWLLKNS